jgi:excisionase family DNA binding protein
MRKLPDVQLIDLDDRLTVTIDRTAHLLDVGRSTVYELLRAGKLKGVKFGRAHRVVCSDARRRPTVCEARRADRYGVKVRQIEVRNDSALAGAGAGSQAGAKTADAMSTGFGECT